MFNDGSIDETFVQGVQDWMCSGGCCVIYFRIVENLTVIGLWE